MAVSVLTCERVLADLDGRAAGSLEEQSRRALADAPQAAEWAYEFTSGVRPSTKGFRRQAAPTIVHDAVEGIAQACGPDPDGMLRDLLVQAIDVCAAWSVATGPRWGDRSHPGRRQVQGRAGAKEDRNHNGTVERERLLRQLQHI
jgi:cytochrome c5